MKGTVMDVTEMKMESPVGLLRLVASDAGLCRVAFGPPEAELRRELARRFGEVRVVGSGPRQAVLDRARHALDRYFSGADETFDGIPLDPGGTEFQRQVWSSLRRIPAGETRSYAEIATAVRRPKAVRAVGSANRVNPTPVIVPCHRVIGSDGAMGGYAGRVDRKEWLLRHEERGSRESRGAAQAVERRTVSMRSRVL
jgi:methylated-DNA-[protein]-cysteine S-methyltransferase